MLIPPRDTSYTSNRLRSQVGKATRAGTGSGWTKNGAMHHVVDEFRATANLGTFCTWNQDLHGLAMARNVIMGKFRFKKCCSYHRMRPFRSGGGRGHSPATTELGSSTTLDSRRENKCIYNLCIVQSFNLNDWTMHDIFRWENSPTTAKPPEKLCLLNNFLNGGVPFICGLNRVEIAQTACSYKSPKFKLKKKTCQNWANWSHNHTLTTLEIQRKELSAPDQHGLVSMANTLFISQCSEKWKHQGKKHLNLIGTRCHSIGTTGWRIRKIDSGPLGISSPESISCILPQKPLQDVPLSESIFLASTATTPMQALFVRKLGWKLLSFS